MERIVKEILRPPDSLWYRFLPDHPEAFDRAVIQVWAVVKRGQIDPVAPRSEDSKQQRTGRGETRGAKHDARHV